MLIIYERCAGLDVHKRSVVSNGVKWTLPGFW